MHRGNLLWYLQFHNAEAQNPQVFFTPRPGSNPCQSTQILGCPHAFTELLPFFRGGFLITKSTEANMV